MVLDPKRVYDKLELIDTKLDNHVKETEHRVTSLEAKHDSVSGKIKIIFSLLLAAASAAITAGVNIYSKTKVSKEKEMARKLKDRLELPREESEELDLELADDLELEDEEEDMDLEEDEEAPEESPLEDFSDDELLEEAKARGLLPEDDEDAEMDFEDEEEPEDLEEDEEELEL